MKRAFPVFLALGIGACGTDVAGPSSSLLACVFGEPASLAAGEALQVRGPENQAVCLAGGAGAEFVYIPFHSASDSVADLTVELTGAGFTDPSSVSAARVELAPGRPSLGAVERAPRYVRDYAFHHRLRRREIRELGPRIRSAAGSAGAVTVAADTPTVGELRDYNVAISCEQQDIRTGRVLHVSRHSVIVVDTANPAELTADDYAFFGETFDTLVYPVETAHFGTPTDIDQNGRSILFFTRAVNERNDPDATAVTIGFFWSGDLFPEVGTERLQACPEANQAEMFYLIAPDPNGDVGVEFTLDEVRELAIPLIGHEFQHLVNASRRLYVNDAFTFEDPWLNEGLSHAAEELLFFAVTGLPTASNLSADDLDADARDSFNRYMGGNFNNFAKYLQRPDTAALMGGADRLSTRGAVWAFLRYAADRYAAEQSTTDQAFYFDVVNGRRAGLTNLDRVVGDRTALLWMRDWSVALYGDDLVPGIDPRFTTTSWNYRGLFEGSTLEEYPLRARTLTTGQTATVDLLPGGLTFNRFGVAADGRAVLHVTVDDAPPPAALRGSFLRVR